MNIKEIRKRAYFYQSNFLEKHPVSNRIIPHLISSTSKMYKKAVNFEDSINLFWNNKGPLTINYNASLNNTKLANVDVLLTDIRKGYRNSLQSEFEIILVNT